MFPMHERQLSLSSLFKKPVHNAVRHFSCLNLCLSVLLIIDTVFTLSIRTDILEQTVYTRMRCYRM